MPRQPRILEANLVYHVYNRRTDRQLLFPAPRDFDEFLNLLEEGREQYNVRICAYCVMNTHWHLAIWIREGDGATMAASFLRWLSACHALRFRYSSGTRGHGHVYQDRYKAKPVHCESHYLILLRYIEANPLDAELVDAAELWRWSSLYERLGDERRIIVPGPVSLPSDWKDIVNGASQFDDYQVVGDGGSASGTEVRARGRR